MNIFSWYGDCTDEHISWYGECTVYILWWIFASIYLNSAIFRATALCDHGARASFFLVGGKVFWCYWILWWVAQEVGVWLEQNIMCILSWGDWWWLLIDWWLWGESKTIWIRERLKMLVLSHLDLKLPKFIFKSLFRRQVTFGVLNVPKWGVGGGGAWS